MYILAYDLGAVKPMNTYSRLHIYVDFYFLAFKYAGSDFLFPNLIIIMVFKMSDKF